MDIIKLLRNRRNLRRLGQYWTARARQTALRSGFDPTYTDTMRAACDVIRCKRLAAHYRALSRLSERALHAVREEHRALLELYARGLSLRQIAALRHKRTAVLLQRDLRLAAESYRRAVDELLSARSKHLAPIVTVLSEKDRHNLYDRDAVDALLTD